MGCPDAVRAELINLPGLMAIRYRPELDIFEVTYRPDKVTIPDIFSAIWTAGRKEGREFRPEQVG